jgi:ParB family chromosome partitioning protein
MIQKKRGLGRNLEALLSDMGNPKIGQEAKLEGNLHQLSLSQIQAGKYQPRQDFSPSALEELANSIRAQGIIQPIVVRSKEDGNYEIIAGERRFRAAKLAGLTTIPALIRELPNEAVIAIALIENIQREDLNPIEEAIAMQRLISEFSLTHEQVANAVGKSRVAVTNLLRLLSLPEQIKSMLAEGKLEMGHARALLSLSLANQIKAGEEIVAKDYTVRAAEELVRRLQSSSASSTIDKKNSTIGSNAYDMQIQLSQKLGLPVVIKQSAGGRGKIIISYKNNKVLEKAFAQLLNE